MRYKVLLAGIVLLFVSSACLPHAGFLAEKTRPGLSLAKEEPPSLFTESELEGILSADTHPPAVEGAVSTDSLEMQSMRKLELPISDESNDDFSLEIFPGDQFKKEPEFDIPIVINAKVEQFIQYFQTVMRSRFSSWLARSEKYIPFMRNTLKEKGLPEDLVYMALIESGFNPYAYSRSKASGPWQFIYLTGKRYGLKVDWWVDERRDPEKSTVAAAKYLKDLYDMFECWYLAAAGYNAGENKIVNAMKRYRTEDFWELSKYRYLKQETKDYVPQMIAAALISKDPEKYGFVGIEYEDPLRYEKVKVPEVTDLLTIAKACETSVEEIKDLNPELLKGCTPSKDPDYEVKIPFGRMETFLKNFETLRSTAKFQFKVHTVKKGDSLPKIAKLHRVDLEPLLEMNQLSRKSRLAAGMEILVPFPRGQERPVAVTAKKKPGGRDQIVKQEEIIYAIRKGDTLWSIANEMGVNIGTLSRWNNLHPEKKLMPGDKLRIRMADASEAFDEPVRAKQGKEITYRVKEGDTLWAIAKKYNVTVYDIRNWNSLVAAHKIRPSDRLILKVGGLRSSTLN